MPSRILVETWREQGPGACVRKVRAATGMALPMMLTGRRTAAGVAAYFDLITDEGRRFYGDSFHFGYFRTGSETLPQALDAHTDLVAEMARPNGRTAHPRCRLRPRCAGGADRRPVRLQDHRGQHQPRADPSGTGTDRAAQDVRPGADRQGRRAGARFPRRFVRRHRLPGSGRRHLRQRRGQGAARARASPGLAPRRPHRLLRSGPAHESAVDRQPHAEGCPLPPRRGTGHRLAGDSFSGTASTSSTRQDIITETMPTWERTLSVYQERSSEIVHRYGRRIVDRTRAQLHRIPAILARHGSFPVLSLLK